MQHIEHPLDKYILTTKAQLTALTGEQEIDTSLLQLQCLEKFANLQGYRLERGLFVNDNPACKVTTLNNMVALYNNTMKSMGEHLKHHGFIEKVYLSGRNLRSNTVVMHHRVKFL